MASGGNGQRPPGGGGPWGGGGRAGRSADARAAPGPLPDLDALIARLQAYIRSLLGGGPRGRFTGGRGLALIGLAVVALWLASGIYRVQPDEQGVVLRFGAFDRTTLPGLNYHMPWPIERVADAGGHPDQPHRDRLPLAAAAAQIESGSQRRAQRAGREPDAHRR